MGLGGIICNSRNVDNEMELLEAFCERLGTQLLYFVPRDNIVQHAEINRQTVIQYRPDSPQAEVYRELATRLEQNTRFCIPTPLAMEDLADLVRDKYHIPYIPVTMFGIEETCKSLREVAAFFGLQERAEAVITRELARIEPELNFYREKLSGKRAMVYVGAPRVWHWIPVLYELGMEVVAEATTFGYEDDYQKINRRARDGVLIIDNPNELELEEVIAEYRPDIFLTGLKEKYLSMKMGVPSINSHSYEDGPYAGITGLLNFARDIYKAIYSPVWKFVEGRERLWPNPLNVR